MIMEKFKYVQGNKSPDDKILLYYNNPVTFEDVAKMIIFFMNNEDRLYPPPAKEAGLFKEYIMDVLNKRKIPTDSKYKVRGKK